MLNEFTISRGRAIINFTLKYCDTKQKLLNSNGFRDVITSFVENVLKKEEIVIYEHYIEHFGNEEKLIETLIEVFKLLTVFSNKEIIEVDKKFSVFFNDRDLFLEVIDLLYDFWKKLERYTIVHNNQLGESLQNVRFAQANEMLNDLILSTYRRIFETVSEQEIRIFHQSTAAGMAGVTLNDIHWDCPKEYTVLNDIPFISSVIIQPPFIAYTKKNTRTGLFQEVNTNPLLNLKNMDPNEWFIFPVKVGNMLAFVYFHKDFMVHGINLANLFEIATEKEYENKKPELIYIFGYPDGKNEKETFYYKDKEHGFLVGYANYCDDVDYFGYMKKMLLTLHNVKQIDHGSLPIHGAMVNIVLKNGKQSNIIIMGDSGAGKSESLEAFRTLNKNYIRHMRIIFDDMGYLEKQADGSIKAYGTEIGAFVRVDDLDPAYAYGQLDKGVYINMDKVNARVTIPISTYDVIMKGYAIDYFLYANNYAEADKKIGIIEDLDKAIEVFENGARKAKGTTSEVGLVKSYFANPFGPVQERTETEKLVREYFKGMKDAGVRIGEMHTSLAIDGRAKDGPKEAAEELFKLINE